MQVYFKKTGDPVIRLYFLFAAFILACGATHFLDAVHWNPAYSFNALVRSITGVPVGHRFLPCQTSFAAAFH